MSIVEPIPIVSEKEAHAAIEAKLVAFNNNKNDLLKVLRDGCKSGPTSKPFDADKSWNEITCLARLYFWGKVMKQNTMPTRDRIKRLRHLAKALRNAHGLARRAIGDGVGDDLYCAWFTHKEPPRSAIKIEKDGSSILTRMADEIKEAVVALEKLKVVSDAALAAIDTQSNTGRPMLLPRDCIQGLARVYRNGTGLKPGRGDGPFAEFAYHFMVAVGQTDFDYRSLIDAIQDAHQRFKPSCFD
jgi:hypothetical protein